VNKQKAPKGPDVVMRLPSSGPRRQLDDIVLAGGVVGSRGMIWPLRLRGGGGRTRRWLGNDAQVRRALNQSIARHCSRGGFSESGLS
jgi:hypothetical protein